MKITDVHRTTIKTKEGVIKAIAAHYHGNIGEIYDSWPADLDPYERFLCTMAYIRGYLEGRVSLREEKKQ